MAVSLRTVGEVFSDLHEGDDLAIDSAVTLESSIYGLITLHSSNRVDTLAFYIAFDFRSVENELHFVRLHLAVSFWGMICVVINNPIFISLQIKLKV